MAAPTYFVPCSAGFENAVMDRTSPRYWKVLIDIDGDDVLEDVTSLVDNNQVTGGGKVGGQTGEAISNQYKVRLRNPGGSIKEGDFAGAACAIEARVGTAEYIRLFTGYVTEEGCSRAVSHSSDDTISVDMVDFTRHVAAGRKTDRKVLVNHTISDPGDTGSSLFHKLTGMLGLGTSDLDVGAKINQLKPYLPLDGKATVLKELQQLAAQYLALLTFRYDGKLRFRSRFEDGWEEPESEWELDETNVHRITGKGGSITCNRVSTEFDEHQVLDQRVIHRNVEDYNVVLDQISIVVGAGEYWPGPGASDTARLSYREPTGDGAEYPIGINIQTPSIGLAGSGSDIESSGGLLTLESFNGTAGTDPGKTNQNADSSEIILYNGTAGPVTITKFEIRGQPVRINKQVTVEDVDNTITNEWEFRDLSIPGRYAVSEAQAHQTTQWWTDYGKIPRRLYDVETDWLPQVQEGAKVTLDLPSLSINMVGVIVSYTHPPAGGSMTKQITRLTIREDYSFTPTGSPNITIQNMGYAGAESADAVQQQITVLEEEVDNRPTYQEIQEGYSEGGGTTTPAKPVVLVCQPVATKAVMLVTDKQLNLTNFDHYEWQVSEDQSSWYSLRFDGTDWKDTLNETTDVDVEFLTHCNIPHTGDPEDPAGRKLYYRVRRVTKVAVESAWSDIVTATTNTVNPGDLAANSVYVNNLVAGIVSAMIAQLNSYLEVGGDGYVGKTYGKTSGYQECGLSGKDATVETGLLAGHAYYFKVTVDGESQAEYSTTTGSDTTYQAVLNLLNSAVAGCLFSVTGGDLRCSSLSSGDSSAIALASGTSGDDLFSALTGFSAFETAVAGSDNPVAWGATRSRIFEDSWIIEFWDGNGWEVIIKGGGRYNDALFPYIQARGIVAPGAESEVDGIDIGDLIPTSGSPRLFRFDNSYADQNASDPWDSKVYLEFVTAGRKFGTHALSCNTDYGKLEEAAALGMQWDSSFGLDYWHYITSFPETLKTIATLGESGADAIHFHGTTDLLFTDIDVFYFDVCKLSETKIAVVFKTSNIELEVRIGEIAANSTITWGTTHTVVLSAVSQAYIRALSENKIVVSYSRSVASVHQSFCKVGTVSGTDVTFGSEQTIQDVYSAGAALIDRLDSMHIVACYGLSASRVCRVGVVSGDTVTFGAEYSFTVSPDISFDLTAISSSRFVVCHRQNSTGYLQIVTGDITGGDGISFGTPAVASGTRDITSARMIKLDSSSFAVTYTESTTYDVYVRRGYFSGSVPAFGSEYAVASSVDITRFSYCGRSVGEDSHEVIFSMADSGLGGGVLIPAKVTSGGVWTFASASSAFDTNVSEAKVLGLNRLFYVCLWSYNQVGASTLESRSAAKDGYTSMSWQVGQNPYSGDNEIACWFVFSQSSASALVSVKHFFTGASPGWLHFSLNYDQSSGILYGTAGGSTVSVDVGSYSLGANTLTLTWDLMAGEKLDDLLVLPSTYNLSAPQSVTHYKNNVRWSIDFDFQTDIIIAPGPGGKVYFPGETEGQIYAVYAP